MNNQTHLFSDYYKFSIFRNWHYNCIIFGSNFRAFLNILFNYSKGGKAVNMIKKCIIRPNISFFFLIASLILTFNSIAKASDVTANSCSASDIRSAINEVISSGGGTVNIPACVETAWGSDKILISSDTPLRILGAGKDKTNFSSSGNYLFKITGNGVTEIGQFTVDFKGAGTTAIDLENVHKNTDTYIHHIKTLNSAAASFNICQSATNVTLLSNLDIRGNKTYGVYVYGPGPLWDYAIPEPNWGENNPIATFIEDSYFYQNGGHVISGFTGAKIVMRHNTFDDMLDTGLDGHAWGYGQSCGQSSSDPRLHANNYGAYQFEIYDNIWENTSARYCVRIRSGTGIVTDNVCDADETVRLAIESKFNTGYDPDEVTGTDTKIYTAIEPHIASNDNRPITGSSWSTYWTQAGSTGGAWTPGETYYPFLSSQSNCQVSVDAMREYWDVINGDSEIYGADGKIDKAPVGYNIPHQWWIWGNTSYGSVFVEEDRPGCLSEGETYWLRAPQAGDPVTSYRKYTYPHPLVSGYIGDNTPPEKPTENTPPGKPTGLRTVGSLGGPV